MRAYIDGGVSSDGEAFSQMGRHLQMGEESFDMFSSGIGIRMMSEN